MGRYNVRGKQDLSGIATLTNDPIALENIKNVAKRTKEEFDAAKLRFFQESMVFEIPETSKNPKPLHLSE